MNTYSVTPEGSGGTSNHSARAERLDCVLAMWLHRSAPDEPFNVLDDARYQSSGGSNAKDHEERRVSRRSGAKLHKI